MSEFEDGQHNGAAQERMNGEGSIEKNAATPKEEMKPEDQASAMREAARNAREATEISAESIADIEHIQRGVEGIAEAIVLPSAEDHRDDISRKAHTAGQDLETISEKVITASNQGERAAETAAQISETNLVDESAPEIPAASDWNKKSEREEEASRRNQVENELNERREHAKSLLQASAERFSKTQNHAERRILEDQMDEQIGEFIKLRGPINFLLDLREKLPTEQSQERMLESIAIELTSIGQTRTAGRLISNEASERARDRMLADVSIDSVFGSREDIEGSLDIIRQILDPTERGRAIAYTAPKIAETDPEKALRMAKTIQDDRIRRIVIAKIKGEAPPAEEMEKELSSPDSMPIEDDKDEAAPIERISAEEAINEIPHLDSVMDVNEMVDKMENDFTFSFREMFRQAWEDAKVAFSRSSKEERIIRFKGDRENRLAQHLKERIAEQRSERDRAQELLELDEARIRIIRGEEQIKELRKATKKVDKDPQKHDEIARNQLELIAKLEAELSSDRQFVDKISTLRLTGGFKKGLRQARKVLQGKWDQVRDNDENVRSRKKEGKADVQKENRLLDTMEERLQLIEREEHLHRTRGKILEYSRQLASVEIALRSAKGVESGMEKEEDKAAARNKVNRLQSTVNQLTDMITTLRDELPPEWDENAEKDEGDEKDEGEHS